MKVESFLEDVFGFDEFRPGQREVVDQLLAGRSALAVFPTGSGKSLCFQLPALMLEGMTLVVSPLIALMKDQIDFLVEQGVRAARLDSSLTSEESRQVWAVVWGGGNCLDCSFRRGLGRVLPPCPSGYPSHLCRCERRRLVWPTVLTVRLHSGANCNDVLGRSDCSDASKTTGPAGNGLAGEAR